jgi:hypothetical protein
MLPHARRLAAPDDAHAETGEHQQPGQRADPFDITRYGRRRTMKQPRLITNLK